MTHAEAIARLRGYLERAEQGLGYATIREDRLEPLIAALEGGPVAGERLTPDDARDLDAIAAEIARAADAAGELRGSVFVEADKRLAGALLRAAMHLRSIVARHPGESVDRD